MNKELDAVEYDNEEKNRWRLEAWCAVQQLADTKRGLILYLPGSKDLDRKVAKKRGFNTAAMIAIERDRNIVKLLRAKGATCIQGDFFDIVESWPDEHPVSVLFADLQCGYDERVDELLYYYVMKPAFQSCVLLLNMQRGRDSSFIREKWNAFADFYEAFDYDEESNPNGIAMIACEQDKRNWRAHELAIMNTGNPSCHRGLLAWWQFRKLTDDIVKIQSATMQGMLTKLNECADIDKSRWPKFIQDMSKEDKVKNRMLPALVSARRKLNDLYSQQHKVMATFMESIRGWPLPSYRSTPSSPLFDSVVMKFTAPDLRMSVPPKKQRMVRYIAAALAIRTMRMNGTL